MKIALITKSKERIFLVLYDERLSKLDEESFEDLYTLNFYLQTIPKKFGNEKTLLIYNNLDKAKEQENIPTGDSKHLVNGDSVKLLVAQDENSYFIDE